MKNIICIIILIVLFLPMSAVADKKEISDIDGNDWREWSDTKKYSFIIGFIAGSSYVIYHNIRSQDDKFDSGKASEIYISYMIPDEKKPKNTFNRNEVSLLLGNAKESTNASLVSYSISGITNDQIADGLDLLYTDFKNRQLKLKDTIFVVKKQIQGASPEEIEATLQYLRSNRDYNKLFYTDKDGKRKYVSFP